tara:strand:- start:1487 stop:1666 length:180 start_codon:yes stop_codon:yes gene_type:complete
MEGREGPCWKSMKRVLEGRNTKVLEEVIVLCIIFFHVNQFQFFSGLKKIEKRKNDLIIT